MASSQSNLQDSFLNAVRKTKNPVTLFFSQWCEASGCDNMV